MCILSDILLYFCFIGITKSSKLGVGETNFPTFSVTCHVELLSYSRFIFHNNKTCKIRDSSEEGIQSACLFIKLDRNGSVLSINIVYFKINYRVIIKEGVFLWISFFL
ncbi:unnamed protein product [Musa acuminata subsp. malaccensis]|uniref:(wild Malaysian banana) hypothetical protein n=1 Tax=Musa acuminata subsp. malaccensis TaxID=214687 RepID=A0A804JRN4_MUSAM|nr:unnamed protein product [Musa acuminata subsp. malaccensis]